MWGRAGWKAGSTIDISRTGVLFRPAGPEVPVGTDLQLVIYLSRAPLEVDGAALPTAAKLLPLGALAYLVSPVDGVPDLVRGQRFPRLPQPVVGDDHRSVGLLVEWIGGEQLARERHPARLPGAPQHRRHRRHRHARADAATHVSGVADDSSGPRSRT